MPSFASVLKDEIRRLAKKEAKAQVASVRAASSRQRRDIAALKRENRDLRRQVARLQRALEKGTGAPAAAEDNAGPPVRFSPEWVAKHRAKLGLSQADYGTLVGVSGVTIYNWEQGRSRPRDRQLAAWGAVKKLGKREAMRQLEDG